MEITYDFINIRKILLKYFEPIITNALLPDDEYNSYILTIINMLNSNCSTEQLSNYLLDVEKNLMSVEPDRERTSLVGRNLIAAWDAKA